LNTLFPSCSTKEWHYPDCHCRFNLDIEDAIDRRHFEPVARFDAGIDAESTMALLVKRPKSAKSAKPRPQLDAGQIG